LFLGVILTGAFLEACAGKSVEAPVRKAQEIPTQRIILGLNENQVAQRLGPPYRTVGTKEFPDGTIVVRHFIVNQVNYLEETGSKKEFYLYFWNGQLVRWDRPDEWETESDLIHDSMDSMLRVKK
jgi:hypothetical protein